MNWLYSIPPLLTLCCFLCLATLTLYRGTQTKTNRLFFLICALAAFLYGAIFLEFNAPNEQTALFISRIDHLFIIFLLPLYFHFFYEYLQMTKYKWLVTAAYVYTGALMVLVPSPYFVSGMERHAFGYFATAGILYPLFGLGGLTVTISSLFFIYAQIRREQDAARKNRLTYVMIGFGLMGLLTGLNFLPIHGIPIYPPGNFSFIPLSIFAVGLFKHDLLDMGILVKRSLVYSILTALLTGFYALIVIIANQMFTEFILSDSLVFPLCFFFFITFVFGPLKNGVQRLVDRFFFKEAYDYRSALKDLSRQIVSVLDVKAIAEKLLSAVERAMQVENCALFIKQVKEERDSGYRKMVANQWQSVSKSEAGIGSVIAYLASHPQPISQKKLIRLPQTEETMDILAWMTAEAVVFVFPLLFRDHINGFLSIGKKRSGEDFTREDVDLLETLCSQSALAIENAHSYEQIEALNTHLEKKVADRTMDLEKALQEKEKTQEQLVRSESLAAIGQLVAGVAHELNNPLASAFSLIQTVVEDLEEIIDGTQGLDPAIMEDLKFAEKELLRARDIVRSLLDLSRQTDGYSEKVDMNAVVRDAIQVLYNQYKQRGIPIFEKCDKNLPLVEGNFAALGQVVVNILQNAIQAMEHRKGCIELSTHHHAEEKQVVFQCSDSGAGIPDKWHRDIFKPFFTTKAVGKGTGLGLYICHEIVKKHHGRLTFASQEGKGTLFMVQLPAV